MRVIIGDGKMSQAIRKPTDVILSHKDVDITDDPAIIAKALRKASERLLVNIGVVINTAAAINLEWCEANPEACWRVNALGPLNVAKACDILGHKMVQISSGCVFDGMETGHFFTEDDVPSPASFYAVAKAAADTMIRNANLDIPVLTLRPRQIISRRAHPTNMLSKFINLGNSSRFITSVNSVTGLEEFSSMIDHLLNVNATGIYNCAQDGFISPYEIALRLRKLAPNLNPLPEEYTDYLKRVKVKRVNTLLDVSRLRESGFVNKTASDVVDWCIENYET